MQGEHWIKIANSCKKKYFADSLGCEKHLFIKQLYKQLIPESLRLRLSVCGFDMIFAAFHLFAFRQAENTGDHVATVLSTTVTKKQLLLFLLYFRKTSKIHKWNCEQKIAMLE